MYQNLFPDELLIIPTKKGCTRLHLDQSKANLAAS